jgi:hypothetical protein
MAILTSGNSGMHCQRGLAGSALLAHECNYFHDVIKL